MVEVWWGKGVDFNANRELKRWCGCVVPRRGGNIGESWHSVWEILKARCEVRKIAKGVVKINIDASYIGGKGVVWRNEGQPWQLHGSYGGTKLGRKGCRAYGD